MIIKKNKKNIKNPAPQVEKKPEPQPQEEEFDITKIEFKERSERRRGDRRRGYRRIDERNLVSRAQMEAESIRKTAVKDGYKAGLTKAEEDINSLKNAIVEFMGAKNQVYEEVSRDILEIALEIAQKIIKKEVQTSKDVFLNVVTEVLGELSASDTRVILKVSPQDVEYARENISQILSDAQIECKILIAPDENVEEGGCVIQTNNGIIDANIKSQLEIVRMALGVQKNEKIQAVVESVEIPDSSKTEEVPQKTEFEAFLQGEDSEEEIEGTE